MTFCTTDCTDLGRAGWIECWPPALQALSQPQVGLQLSRPQLHALGRLNGMGLPVFDLADGAGLTTLTRALEAALQPFAQGAFVRLGSRSPKDTAAWLGSGGRACNAQQALAMLGGGSLRVFQDLRLCARQGWLPWVFLRQWRDMAAQSEWRGFVCDGHLRGLSQYHRSAVQTAADLQALQQGGVRALVGLAGKVQAALAQRCVVFDAWLRPDGQAELIELNPCGPSTSMALFDPLPPAGPAVLRWRAADGLASAPLASFQAG